MILSLLCLLNIILSFKASKVNLLTRLAFKIAYIDILFYETESVFFSIWEVAPLRTHHKVVIPGIDGQVCDKANRMNGKI